MNPVMRALLDVLSDDGADLALYVPEWGAGRAFEHQGDGPRPGLAAERRRTRHPDLVLLKTATSLGLALASGQQAGGGRFLNGARASLRAADKAATLASLAAVGLPVPATWLWPPRHDGVAPSTAPPATSHGFDARHGTAGWVTKPVHGIHGTNVRCHPDLSSAVSALEVPNPGDGTGSFVVDDGCRMLQARVGEGDDIKVYVAGDAVFTGRKAFDASSFDSDRVERVRPDRETVELALRTGRALGLRLVGLDLRQGRGGPWIVDVNAFPGYRGFPEAVDPLRHEIGAALGPARAPKMVMP